MRSTTQPWSIVPGGTTTGYSKREMNTWLQRIFTSQAYKDRIEAGLLNGSLPVQLEVRLHEHVYGKPVENINLNVQQGQKDLSQLSPEELLQHVQGVAVMVNEMVALREAIPAELVEESIAS